MEQVHGTCEAKLTAVREAFARRFAIDEVGASLAVDLDGETVVDLWGGFCDEARTRPWARDTIVNLWSTTKTITALAALTLVERGLLDVYAPVARYWPEFAQNGKERIEVRHLMSHTSGVSGWDPPFTVEDMYDLEAATARLAAQAPWWEPGTASGYHAFAQGYLIGELVRRTSGKSLTRFVAEELAGPLDADFQIGAREADWPRIAPVIPPPPLPFDLAALDPKSPMLIFDEQSDNVDLVLGLPLRMGIGFGLPHPISVPEIPEGRVCFWGGWGGSIIIMDLDRRLTISYAMNRMAPGIVGSERSAEYVRAVYAALGR